MDTVVAGKDSVRTWTSPDPVVTRHRGKYGLRIHTVSDSHTFVLSLHRYRYCYVVSNNDRYKRTLSVICL
jgi:hypothetical protein